MGKLVNIEGQTFGRLTCLEMAGRKNGHVQWKFKCDCGNTVIARGLDVRRGKTNSCGCYHIERASEASKGISPLERKERKERRLNTLKD